MFGVSKQDAVHYKKPERMSTPFDYIYRSKFSLHDGKFSVVVKGKAYIDSELLVCGLLSNKAKDIFAVIHAKFYEKVFTVNDLMSHTFMSKRDAAIAVKNLLSSRFLDVVK